VFYMLEADLRDLLAVQLHIIEAGLTLIDKEKYIPNTLGTRSFIDLLAHDREKRWVLIELKRSDAAAREAIHEIYKYVEGVKAHLRARDDEIRAFIVSTEWTELLVPFSRFVQDTIISVNGFQIEIGSTNKKLFATAIAPLTITAGRILSPWHEISLYRSEERLKEGIVSYDTSCRAKGIEDYVLVIMTSPEGFYDRSVLATAKAFASIRGQEPTDVDIDEALRKVKRLDWMIYFVPQLLTADVYLDIIKGTPELFEEAKDFKENMSSEEALCSLQSYALDARPKVDRDYFEIGYPAKFKTKLLDQEGWAVSQLLRRGAFARNSALTDSTILGEISGDAGASGQRFKRSINLNDKAAFSSALSDIKECLVNNPAWSAQIASQLDEARTDFSNAAANISVYSPSTGIFTIFFTTAREDGFLYVPTYSIIIAEGDNTKRLYAGELTEATDTELAPTAFSEILAKYYYNDIGILCMLMTSGGYETRDAQILGDLSLDYTSFRCDIDGDDRTFFRSINSRWRKIGKIEIFGAYNAYLEKNTRLVTIIDEKLGPRIGSVICEGSSASRQLEHLLDPEMIKKARYYVDPPTACDICCCPLSAEPFMSDARLDGHRHWANLCADCTIFHAEGIGWGVGQLYRNEGGGRWLLVAGGSSETGQP
jgi:hypothetical protein